MRIKPSTSVADVLAAQQRLERRHEQAVERQVRRDRLEWNEYEPVVTGKMVLQGLAMIVGLGLLGWVFVWFWFLAER